MDRKVYDSIHGWLRRNFTKSHICSSCKTTSANKYDWALKKGCEYAKDINNFIELCRSCHLEYDYTEQRSQKVSISQTKSYLTNSERRANQGKSLRKEIEKYNPFGLLLDTFKSAREASRITGIDVSSITNCCNGKRGYKSAGGYIWKYKN